MTTTMISIRVKPFWFFMCNLLNRISLYAISIRVP